MAEKVISTRIIQKHDTAVNWSKAINFIPKKGELIVYDADTDSDTLRDGYYTVDGAKLDTVTIDGVSIAVTPSDTIRFKIGNGETNVNLLPFVYQNNLDIENLLANGYNGTNVLEFYNPNYLETYIETPSNGLKAIILDGDNAQPTNVSNSFLISPCLDSYVKNTISFTADEDGHHKFGLAAWANNIHARIASVKMFNSSGDIIPFPSQPSGDNKKVVKFSSFASSQLYPHAGAGTGTTGYGDVSPDGTKEAWISNAAGMSNGPFNFGGAGAGTGAWQDTTMSQDADGACLRVTTMAYGQTAAAGVYNTTQNTEYTLTFYFRRPEATNHAAYIKVKGSTPDGESLCTDVTIAKTATSGWSKATMTFNSGSHDQILVLVVAQHNWNYTTGTFYLDNICLESSLPAVPSMDDLIQNYAGKDAITEIGFTATGFELDYPEDTEIQHTFGDPYVHAFVTATAVNMQKYLFNVATGYLTSGEQYTIEVVWKMLSQESVTESYTTYSDADKVALVTTACVTREQLQTGGYWVGDPIGNRRNAYLRIFKDSTRRFQPRVLAVNITRGAETTGAEVSVRFRCATASTLFKTSRAVYKNGTVLIPIALLDEDAQWLSAGTTQNDWNTIEIGIANLDPHGHPVTVDKIAIYGDRVGSYTGSYATPSFAEVEGNKRVTFDNIVRASEFDGIIDDGCLDVY